MTPVTESPSARTAVTRSAPSVRHPRPQLLLPSIFIFVLTWILLLRAQLSDRAQEDTSFLTGAIVSPGIINNFKAFPTLVDLSLAQAPWLTISTPRTLSTLITIS